MTVMIDEPRWWFDGRHWSHLASDRDLDELHEFAGAIGIPRRGFHGDHYDVPEEWYEQVVESGAVPTTSRKGLVGYCAQAMPAMARSAVPNAPWMDRFM